MSLLSISAEGSNAYALTLGQEEEIQLAISVDNYGESAYEAQLFVHHHASLHYIAINMSVSFFISSFCFLKPPGLLQPS